jgi:CBS domain-containing protein/gamma-glutamyl:cysteine ligase YbdK (ATP-grasp superfamily)
LAWEVEGTGIAPDEEEIFLKAKFYMGQHQVALELKEPQLQGYMKALLQDLRALEFMLEDQRLESGVIRIGAEQEMFLVNENLGAAPVAVEVLERAKDPRLTTEIARFNLEANLTPVKLTNRCFRTLEDELNAVLDTARSAASASNADVLLAGILPTLEKSDLSLENITPVSRYYQLNHSISRLRGGPFSIHIKGLDELQVTHDNIMMESCNTSFQIHFQVSPAEFAKLYNLAQAITAPTLAAAVNSPLLFGNRLWQETRLAVFQHSTDARSRTLQERSYPTRVHFGDKWLEKSIVELFHDQIARFRVIMVSPPDEDPMQVLQRGGVPKLSALRLHNGTIWPWNRGCYGITDGVPHLRIENRVLPSGPTVIDEIANTALFIGLMIALPQEYGDISKLMKFDEAKANFWRAARHGLNAQFTWIDGLTHSASALMLDHLLPLARAGLKEHEIAAEDIDHYLGVIEERVKSGRTGAQWVTKSLAAMQGSGTRNEHQRLLAATMLTRQKIGEPVHRWPLIEESDSDDWSRSYQTIGQFMSTDLFTVRPDDLIDLAASMMDWRHIRHVPVEDDEGNLVGLVTHRGLLRHLIKRGGINEPVAVRDIMKPTPVTVQPTTPTLEAMRLMQSRRVGCLPVVEEGRLIGIVTSYDFLEATARLFKKYLGKAPV